MKPQDPTQPTEPESTTPTLEYRKPLTIRPLHSIEVDGSNDGAVVPQESEYEESSTAQSDQQAASVANVPNDELSRGGFKQESQNFWANEKAGPPPPTPLEGQDEIDEKANKEAMARIPMGDKGIGHYIKIFFLTLFALAVLAAAALAVYIFTRPADQQELITARLERAVISSPIAGLLVSEEVQAKRVAEQLANAVVACDFSQAKEIVAPSVLGDKATVPAAQISSSCSDAREQFDETDFSFVRTVDTGSSTAIFEYQFEAIAGAQKISTTRILSLEKQEGSWLVVSAEKPSQQADPEALSSALMF